MLLSQTETQEALAEKGMFQLSAETVRTESGWCHQIILHYNDPLFGSIIIIMMPLYSYSVDDKSLLIGTEIVPGNPTSQTADNNFGVPIRSSWGKQLYWLCRRLYHIS
jgi:hypothetical protein